MRPGIALIVAAVVVGLLGCGDDDASSTETDASDGSSVGDTNTLDQGNDMRRGGDQSVPDVGTMDLGLDTRADDTGSDVGQADTGPDDTAVADDAGDARGDPRDPPRDILDEMAGDDTPPVPGGEGMLTPTSQSEGNVMLEWVQATDDVTGPADLVYTVYASAEDNLSSVDSVLENGTIALGPQGAPTTGVLTGFAAAERQYLVVVVEDEAGNRAIYDATLAIYPYDWVAVELVQLNYAGLALFDADNDHDLDLLLSGTDDGSTTVLYENVDGTFTAVANPVVDDEANVSPFPGFSTIPGVAAGDFDGDLYDDLYLSSLGQGGFLYRNLGNFVFELVENPVDGAAFEGVYEGRAVWVNTDNDLYLDLFIVGYLSADRANSEWGSLLYHNNGDGSFTLVENPVDGVEPFAPLAQAWCAWADVDDNDYLDVVLSNGALYTNGGDDVFTEIATPVGDGDAAEALIGPGEARLDFGYFNDDAYPDLFITGFSAALYTGDGDGTFTVVDLPVDGTSAIDPLRYGGVSWADFDGDERDDLLICGDQADDPGIHFTRLYVNNGNGTLSEVENPGDGAPFPGVSYGGCRAGDLDLDGDMDIILVGKGITAIFINEGEMVFSAPVLAVD